MIVELLVFILLSSLVFSEPVVIQVPEDVNLSPGSILDIVLSDEDVTCDDCSMVVSITSITDSSTDWIESSMIPPLAVVGYNLTDSMFVTRARIENNYAYLADPSNYKIHIVDISDLTCPEIVSTTTQYGMGVMNDLLVWSDRNIFAGDYRVDITYKTDPVIYEIPDIDRSNQITFRCVCVNIVYYTLSSSSGFAVYDVSDPANFIFKSQSDDFASDDCEGIDIDFPYLYIACLSSGVYIYNVTDPTSPEYVDLITELSVARDVVSKNGLIYVTDEDYGLRIYNSTTHEEMGSYETTLSPGRMRVLGKYAYLATDDSSSHLEVIEVTDPSTPFLVEDFTVSDAIVPDMEVLGNFAVVPNWDDGVRVVRGSGLSIYGSAPHVTYGEDRMEFEVEIEVRDGSGSTTVSFSVTVGYDDDDSDDNIDDDVGCLIGFCKIILLCFALFV